MAQSRREQLAGLAPYQVPVLWRGIVQLAGTFLPLGALLASMYLLLAWHVLGPGRWLALALALPAAGLIVRVFIIQHDCGHGSFFRSRRANDVLGWVCSVFTLTPYANWRRQHANHHAMWNNLDRRHSGADIYSTCLTVAEYRALAPRKRTLYRVAHHPLIAQLLLPPLIFMVLYRVPFDTPRAWRLERASVWLTNLAIALVFAGLMLALGPWHVVAVQLTTMAIAAIIGVWLFAVQHRFEDALWSRQAAWEPSAAALRGSSYLHLPAMLRWFSGNIGFHHLHHLAPRVPNYRLADAHRACPDISGLATRLSLWQAMRATRFALWDEDRARMVPFSAA